MTSSIDPLIPLEKAVLEKLLSGESEGYRILQTQISALRVTERKMTGVGFFTRFSLPDEAPKLPDEASLEISDVGADLNDLERGAGFIFFIRINMLEGFTYGESWPRNVRSFHLYYDGTSERV